MFSPDISTPLEKEIFPESDFTLEPQYSAPGGVSAPETSATGGVSAPETSTTGVDLQLEFKPYEDSSALLDTPTAEQLLKDLWVESNMTINEDWESMESMDSSNPEDWEESLFPDLD